MSTRRPFNRAPLPARHTPINQSQRESSQESTTRACCRWARPSSCAAACLLAALSSRPAHRLLVRHAAWWHETVHNVAGGKRLFVLVQQGSRRSMLDVGQWPMPRNVRLRRAARICFPLETWTSPAFICSDFEWIGSVPSRMRRCGWRPCLAASFLLALHFTSKLAAPGSVCNRVAKMQGAAAAVSTGPPPALHPDAATALTFRHLQALLRWTVRMCTLEQMT